MVCPRTTCYQVVIVEVSSENIWPLGFSPFIIKLKVLFQTLCVESVEWDEPLQGRALKQWNCFMSEAKSLNQLRVPRCYFLLNSIPTQVQLHGFSDASEQAFAAAVYPDGTITTRLVAVKTRVAQWKTVNSTIRTAGSLDIGEADRHSRKGNGKNCW